MELSALTQEQKWGLAYKCQQANVMAAQRSAFIVEQNERITLENVNLIEKRPLLTVPAVLTVEQYVLAQLAQMGNEGYSALVDVKFNSAKAIALALPPDQLAALLVQFEIPDVLES